MLQWIGKYDIIKTEQYEKEVIFDGLEKYSKKRTIVFAVSLYTYSVKRRSDKKDWRMSDGV